jgi:ferrous-iron efflux pump FieF
VAYCAVVSPAVSTFEQRARLLRRATLASSLTAFALALIKGAAYAFTGSVAVLAALIDSLMDLGASLLLLFAVRYSLRPADDDHRFGHGKSEALAGLAQALFVTASAALLLVQAFERLLHPVALTDVPAGIAVMAASIVVTFALVLYQRHVVRVTGSSAIAGDALHFTTDLATHAAAIAALALAAFGVNWLDPVFAIAIALSTAYAALRIGRDAFAVLMDRELPEEVQERIRTLALAHAEVAGVHDLRTRQSGATKVIQLHLELDGRLALHDAHRISVEVEHAIRSEFPEADVVIHEDPVGLNEAQRFR